VKAYLGQDLPRSDAHAKVTGQARYTAELTVPGLVYATLVGSTVASGRILSVQFPPGPVGSLCHLNAPVLGQSALFDPGHPKMGAAANREAPFQSDRVNYYGQPVACVVAASLRPPACRLPIR
jgi:xanthine dehydrogenase YagR molybdenum-binding subunit